MAPAVGIDDLNLYGSTLAVEAREIAAARGTPARDIDRLEALRRSLAPAWEDPVTLAVNAALPIVDEAGADAFELLIVATESGVDYGKPLSSYVHRCLELPTRCRNVELKHACYAGTAGLQLAASWAAAHGDPARKALVVMTDMARRIFEDPAEPVEGAGAVALSVSCAPRVLALEDDAGFAAREVYDVTRPTPTLERANAKRSLAAYLDLLEIAAGDYAARRGGIELTSHFAALLYHTPLVPLVRQAHHVLVDVLAPEADFDFARETFAALVGSSFAYCREIGNIYSGSLYAALAGRIDADPPLAAGDRLGLFSYGSGSCAEFYGGLLGERARAVVGRHAIADHLAARRTVDVPTYEALVHAHERSLTEADFTPDRETPDGHYEAAYAGRGLLVLTDVDDYYRRYERS